MKNRNLNHKDDWATPEWLYKQLDDEFQFDFDPCPLNPTFNGLEVEWGKSNFVNPPYSNKKETGYLKSSFVKKGFNEWKKGKLVVFLLPVSTSSKLFHEWIYPYAEIRFLKGRVSFRGVNTKGIYVEKAKPMHDSMICIFRTKN